MHPNILFFRVVLHDDRYSSELEQFGDDGFSVGFFDTFDTTSVEAAADTVDFFDTFDTTSVEAAADVVDFFFDTFETTSAEAAACAVDTATTLVGDCEIVVDTTTHFSAGGGVGCCEVGATDISGAAADPPVQLLLVFCSSIIIGRCR